MPQLQPWPLLLSLALLRLLLVLGGFFVLLPRLLLPNFPDRGSAGMVGRFCIFAFIEVAVAHLLAPLRLYEGLTVVGILVLALLWRFYFSLPADKRFELDRRLIMQSMDFIDRVTGDTRLRKQPQAEETQPAAPIVRRRPLRWADLAILVVVVAVAAWLRYDQGFRHITPAFSDAPVTLQWTKQFGNSDPGLSGMQLIYAPSDTGNVYPRGMYAFISFLRKFTGQSVYLTMVAFGPMMNLITILTMAGFLRWSTGSTLAGAIGALVYGVILTLSPGDVTRYAAYNSQEFSMIFCLPAAWFGFRYLVDGKRGYLWAAATGAGVIMFTHLVSTWIVACLLAAAVITAAFARQTSLARVAGLVGACALVGVIAVSPMGLAVLTGLKFHSESVNFLTNAVTSTAWLPPNMPPLWYLALTCAPALLAPFLAKEGRIGVWFGLLAVLAAGVAWIAPFILRNLDLPGMSAFASVAVRAGEAGAIGLGLAAGLSWFALERVVGKLAPWPAVPVLLCAGVVGAAMWFCRPTPLDPVRVSTDEEMTQLIRLDNVWHEGDWVVVSGDANYLHPDQVPLPGRTTLRVNMGYSMALGRGGHQYPQTFVQDAKMGAKGWCWQGPNSLDTAGHNIALFLDDQFPDSKKLLQDWMAQHKNLPWSEVYTSPSLQVWTIQYPVIPDEQIKTLWGEKGMTCGTILEEPR